MKLKPSILLSLAAVVALATAPNAMALLTITDLLLSEKIEAYQAEQQALIEERRQLAESLRDKTPAEKRAAIETFQQQQAERIADHRALGEEIRSQISPHEPLPRPTRTSDQVVTDQPERPQPVVNLIDDFKTERDLLLQKKRELLEQYKDASHEERQAALEQWREERAAAIREIREAAKSLKESVKETRENRRN